MGEGRRVEWQVQPALLDARRSLRGPKCPLDKLGQVGQIGSLPSFEEETLAAFLERQLGMAISFSDVEKNATRSISSRTPYTATSTMPA